MHVWLLRCECLVCDSAGEDSVRKWEATSYEQLSRASEALQCRECAGKREKCSNNCSSQDESSRPVRFIPKRNASEEPVGQCVHVSPKITDGWSDATTTNRTVGDLHRVGCWEATRMQLLLFVKGSAG
mmetsp:Transcript_75979/g.178265  ORF Transcript_75979/g.178265 Transcript_75979/m.178265 type:complete len:128 (+) Transcript_75979:1109-1492(+)